MQSQKMVIDFANKTNQDSKLVYKVGDYDKNGIDATLKGIDTAGLTAHLCVRDSEGTTQFTGAVSVAGDIANFRLPTTGPGTWFFELVAKNSNGEESSARYKYRLIERIGYDASVTIEYETLYTQISDSYAKWQQDHERYEQTNSTLLATNLKAEAKINEVTVATTNATNATTTANQATVNANKATADAQTATNAATNATLNANQATEATLEAISNAIQATIDANTATENANAATTNVTNATVSANQATVNANKATTDAQTATQSVQNAIAAGTVDLEPKQARTDTSGFEHANLKARLDADYKRLSEEFFGVEFHGSNSTGKRLGRAYGLIANVGLDSAVNINDFDNQFPWSDIQTVNLNHDGVVTAIEGFPNFTRDGSNGEVMVRIPKFYQKREQNEDGSIRRYFISKHKLSGYFLNPAFIDSDSGKELDYAFIGAYEASSDGTKLFSRSGLYPQVSLNRAGFRTRATATGAGFHLEDVLLRNLIETLFYIEFATTNSQSIMNGQVNFSAQKTTVATTDTNYVIVSNTSANQYTIGQTLWLNNSNRKLLSKEVHDASNTRLVFEGTALTFAVDSTIDMRGWQCGSADSVLQRSGSIVSNTAGKSPFVYRGIENPWGNIWEFVDGICVKDWQTYVCTDYKLYADQKYTLPYRPIGQLNGNANGYVSKMIFDEIFPFVQVPSSVSGGGSTTYFADYYYQNSGERTAFVGGGWSDGANAGLSFWNLSYSPAPSNTSVGGRLAYKPSS